MAHWRNTFKPARFAFMDARAGVPLLAALLHVRPWTMALAAAAIGVFWYLERVGMSFPAAARGVRAWFAGSLRPAKRPSKVRCRVDYDRRPLG